MRVPRQRVLRTRSIDGQLSRKPYANSIRSGTHSNSDNDCASCGAVVCAFLGGAAFAALLWGRLQASGVGGPWARGRIGASVLHGGRLDALDWRRQYLANQVDIANSLLHTGDPRRKDNPLLPPESIPASYRDELHSRTGLRGKMVGIHEQPQENRYDREATTDRVEHKAEEPRWQHADAGRLVPSGKSAPAAAAGVGVDAAGHFILGLSQEAFGSTPVDQMMSHYDTKICDKSFGNGLVDEWRQTGTDCCRGREDPQSSSIRCHLIRQDDHHGNGDNLVHMKNVQVDLSDFADPRVAQDIMSRYKKSRHEEQAYVQPRSGAIKGTCDTDPRSWQRTLFPGWNADWTTRAFEGVQELQCDQWVEHPVLVVQRDTFANLFHDSEDFVNTFLAMAIRRQSPADLQVFITDLYPRGPFWPMWDKVFGTGRPTITSWDIGQLYGGKQVCFRDLTVGIFGPAAPTTLARLVTKCFHTALVRSYSDFVIRGLGLQGMTRYASPPTKKVVVTWMARRSSVQWPERAYCSEDGKESFFTCDYFRHLDTRQLQRRVLNEAAVVSELRTLERHPLPNGAEVEIRDVDYNLLSFEDQIKNDLETDVMIGPHGAGLFHIIFTPDRAALIELQIDGTQQRKHFNNLAKWSGHSYVSRGGPNPVLVSDTKAMVVSAIMEMDLSNH